MLRAACNENYRQSRSAITRRDTGEALRSTILAAACGNLDRRHHHHVPGNSDHRLKFLSASVAQIGPLTNVGSGVKSNLCESPGDGFRIWIWHFPHSIAA